MSRGTIGRDVGGILKKVLEWINGCFPTVDLLGFALPPELPTLSTVCREKNSKTEARWNIQVLF